MSKRKTDRPQEAAATRAPIWRERRAVLVAGAILLLVLVVSLAGPSAGIALPRLLVEGTFLILWLAAAAGYGEFAFAFAFASSALQGEGRGEGRSALSPAAIFRRSAPSVGESAPSDSTRFYPHPNPLPARERGQDYGLRAVSIVALGLGIIGLLQLGLGLVGLLHRWTALLAIVIGVALLAFRIRRLRPDQIGRWLHAPADWDWLWLLATPALAMALVAALVPPGVLWGDEPHGYDVLEYHLQLPREFYELHTIAPLHHNVFSYLPLGMEMQYLTAMELHRGPWAGMYLAQLMHVVVAALAVVATYAAARQFAGKLPATLAAVAMANVPWMGLLAPVAYNEGALLLFTTLAVAWALQDDRRAWLVGGAMAGFACGVKLTAVPQVLLLVPIVAAAVAIARRERRERTGEVVIRAAAFIFAGLVTFSPWLIRNFAWTRNPVFPEAQLLFGRAHFSQTQEQRWHDAHSPPPVQRSALARVRAAWDQIARDWRYGFVFLPVGLACAAVASTRSPQARVILILLLAWLVFWIALTHLQGRFYVTAIPLAAVGLAMMRTRRERIFTGFVAILVAIVGITISLVTFQERVGPYCQGASLAFDDFAQIHSVDVNDVIAGGHEVALVGDAKAFLYPMARGKLHYRTVFDVDVKPGQSVIEAWTEGITGSPEIVVDPVEIDRFSKTYYGIPSLPGDFPGPRDRVFILTTSR